MLRRRIDVETRDQPSAVQLLTQPKGEDLATTLQVIRLHPSAWAATVLAAILTTGTCAVRLQSNPAVYGCCYFSLIGVTLSAIDVTVMRLPDFLTIPSYPVLLVTLAWAASAVGEAEPLYRAVGSAVALLGGMTVLHLRAGVGLGDVKLAGLAGLLLGYFGWPILFHGLFVAALCATLWAVASLVYRNHHSTIPLGPAVVIGTLVAVLL